MRWSLAKIVAVVLVVSTAVVLLASGSGDRPAVARPDNGKNPRNETRIAHVPGETSVMLSSSRGVDPGTRAVASPTPRVIVTLKDLSLGAMSRSLRNENGNARARAMKAHEERLRQTHDEIKRFISGKIPSHNGVFREYLRVANAVATRVDADLAEALKSHPLVESVIPDVVVHTCLEESVPLIGADTLWTTPGATGTGVRVAVIDTGVDYRHPDLGGGFGGTYKVIGGYDFVNNDADPLDDNGHGTHVAGIIAANGTLKGVAPGASLLAVKVMSAGGTGYSSDIIAGIEWAVDPDGNPATDDGAHVISMSLGGTGTSDDPLSQAVDEAVNDGVVCVVAAGNSGAYGYFTVSSPGVARKALTVGASDNNDIIAGFSSRGPVEGTWDIKPDVTAPGVNVNSTYLNNGYAVLSGTSMATPHVAGVAALLRQIHPGWSAEEIKGVVVEKAQNINLDNYTQGGGRVRAVEANNARAVMIPSSVSFGTVDTAVALWTKTIPVRIDNLSGATDTYAVTLQSNLPAGAVCSVSPSSVTLGPGESRTIDVTIAVDNTTVPAPTGGSKAYEGRITAASAEETLTVPFAVGFMTGAYLDIAFDAAPWYVWIHNRIPFPYTGTYSRLIPYPGTSLKVAVNANYSYDIVVGYSTDPTGAYNPQTRIFRERIPVASDRVAVSIAKSEAVHRVDLRALDAGGRELIWGQLYDGAPPWGSDTLFNTKTNPGSLQPFGLIMAGEFPRNALYFSNMSSDYSYGLYAVSVDQQTGWSYYDFTYSLYNGVTQSQTLANSTQFKHVTHAYSAPAGVGKIYLIPGVGHADDFFPVSLWKYDPVSLGTGIAPSPADVINAPFVREAYYSTETGYWNRRTQYLYQYNGTLVGDGDDPALLATAWFETPNASTVNGYSSLSIAGDPRFSTTTSTLSHPVGPHGWFGFVDSWTDNGQVRLSFTPSQGSYSGQFFMGQLADNTLQPTTYEIVSGTTPVANGVITPNVSPWNIDVDLPSHGIYTLKVPYNNQYSVNGRLVTSQADVTIDTTKAETMAPSLYRLQLLSDGVPTDTTDRSHASNQIVAGFSDSNFTQGKVYYSATNQWTPLIQTTSTGLTTANISGDMLTGYYNLKIVANDSSGNSISQEIKPGFFHNGINSYLSNISTRGFVGTGSNNMIGGFIITGNEPMTVLIRSYGPTLVDYGLTGVLANPYLKLYSSGAVVARNDNWQTSDPLMLSPVIWKGTAADVQATGFAPSGTNSVYESALLVTLPPGLYTASLSGVSNGTGTGLIGVFALSQYPSSSRLTNISTRGFVGTGSNNMIGGFIISGTAPKKVLIRSYGPTLVDYGLTGVLANPYLKLYSSGAVVARNDNWQTSDPLMLSPVIWKGTAADVQATGFAPSGTNSVYESALLVTLPPGLYTASLSGVSNGTGTGLIGVFEIPE